MKILCIDDRQDELEKANQAVVAAGHEFLGALMDGSETLGAQLKKKLPAADGVISDLHFAPIARGHREYRSADGFPGGLLAQIEAMAADKPFVFCTAMDSVDPSDYHHGARFAAIHDSECTAVVYRLYDGYSNGCETKNWERALKSVLKLCEQKSAS
jgi:hypothetical protein